MRQAEPDTITEEKLLVMKKYGVERISINPQTMNQKTLDLIGRRHSVEDIKSVYKTARKIGFKDINMDLILGLPNETVEDVENTMRQMGTFSRQHDGAYSCRKKSVTP